MSEPEQSASKAVQPVALDAKNRALAQTITSSPIDFDPATRTWVEEIFNSLMPTTKFFEAMVARIAHPVGFWLIVPDDLTAQTGVYEYTHPLTGLKYLYCNGAAASQTTYADLYALWGASKYGADSGGNFVLPDTRGRSLWLAGTHTNTDVGDTDGQSEASREPKHKHTSGTLGISGAPSAGTLGVTPNPHSHSINTSAVSAPAGRADIPAGAGINVGGGSEPSTQTTSLSITGAPGVGTLGVSGEAGSGMGGSDAVAHIVIGSLVVRF